MNYGKILNQIGNELENPAVQHIGRLPARSNLIPSQKAGVYYKNKEESELLQSLNGIWRFKYCETEAPEDFYEVGYDDSAWDSIDVPSMWQFRGYGKCKYPNTYYPIPFNPPYICCDNPIGCYRLTFVPDRVSTRTVLHFGGVDNAFYVYVNGEFVGFSKGSRIPSEFDLSGLIHEGENLIAVKVYTYSDATYLENQDMLLASGIFRDVYLLHTDDVSLWDFRSVGSSEGFDIKLNLCGTSFEGWRVKVSLDGEVCSLDAAAELSCSFKLDNPLLWSDEEPNLYELLITLLGPEGQTEIHSKKIGIINSCVKGNQVLVNGKPIYIKGINRHEYDCKNGRAVSVELIEKELKLIKENNINAVRCSHYTNNPAFYEICSEIGIMVMDEADIESHGCEATGDQGYLSKRSGWLPAFLDRIDRMLMQNKNEACIIMRSLGNENGKGENLIECVKRINEFDPTKITIHSQQEFYNDLISNEYTEYDTIKRCGYLSEEKLLEYLDTNPIVMQVEYAHAMGNSPGFLEDYQRYVYERDNYAGGFAWEFKNHGFYSEDEDGNPYYKYGSDFGDFPNWYNFCLDGYLMSVGTPKHSWYELGEVFAPVYVTYDRENGVIKAKNTYNFRNLNSLILHWELCEDYMVIKSGRLNMPSVEPHADCVLDIDTSVEKTASGAKYYLNLHFFDGDRRVGTSQIELGGKAGKAYPAKPFDGKVTKSGSRITVSGEKFEITFENGMPRRFIKGGKTVFDAPICFNLYRAPTDNDGILGNGKATATLSPSWFGREAMDWDAACLDTVSFFAEETDFSSDSTSAKVHVKGKILPMSKYYGFDTDIEYTVYGDGLLAVKIHGEPYGKTPANLPRIGLHLPMPSSADNVTWYGRGERENYSDCKKASPIGLYTRKISDTYTVFDMPQETGNHENTSFVTVYDGDGCGLTAIGCEEFAFSYHDFTQKALTDAKHKNELKKDSMNHLYIDYKMRGLGSHSCGPEPEERYELRPHAFEFAFLLCNAAEPEAALCLARSDFGIHTGAVSSLTDTEKENSSSSNRIDSDGLL